ncbi:unnamed protein product [Lepeophtheirus salmonis]|uniref:(salmon louse) hypothetical protein n=1 Tax=Lepeophtheirus salmonis TaxID=72036 RepID=A0A7R8CF85_LEPSM|nr:unnamed protein product [Lepeophtheirus salmonis]CAF2804086.1 unnamed protein product [Lepeophtheirus salmonis]
MLVKCLVFFVLPGVILVEGGHTFHGFSVGPTKTLILMDHQSISSPKDPTAKQNMLKSNKLFVSLTPEKVCSQHYKKKYATEYVEECVETYRKDCHPTTRPVKDIKCDTTYEEVCTKETEKSYETIYKEECHDIIDKVCAPYGYPPYRHCRPVKKPHCKKVPVNSPKYVVVPKCTKVPKQVVHDIPVEKCETIPREHCHKTPKKVPKEVCKQYKH